MVKMWFAQPFRAQRRRAARVAKAARLFPMPCDQLRPLVTGCSIKYNLKVREGRGFSTAELAGAKLSALRARQLRIATDSRRQNKSQLSLDRNVARLNEYLSKVVVLNKDATKAEIKQNI